MQPPDPGATHKAESWPDWKVALVITLALRIGYSMLAAAASPFLHPDPALIHSNALTDNLPTPGTWYYALLGVWERFDTLWYLRIAAHGYDKPMAVIFYPLYPLAIRIGSWGLPAVAAALLVSTIAAFFYFWGFLRLSGSALKGVKKLCALSPVLVWPTSFVLFAGYAESLTLALIVWSVILAREERWGLASLCGLLAGLSRPSGILVALPLFVLALRSGRVALRWVTLTPIGLLGYWGWLWRSGHRSVVEAYRLYQGTPLVPPWRAVSDALRLVVYHGDIVLGIKLALVVLFFVLSLRSEVRIEEKLFAVAVILQLSMYTGRPFLGAMKHLLICYPAFMVIANYGERANWRRFGFYLLALEGLNLAWMWAFLNWSLVL